MTQVLTYVPQNVVLLLSGYRIEGWTEIAVKRNSPNFKPIRGIRGTNTRTRIKDTSATLTITTFQSELLNEVLSTCLAADMSSGNVRLEIVLKESTGSSFFSTTTGYITGYPELKYADDLGTVTWEIVCDESSFQIGSARSAAVGIVENGIARLKEFTNTAMDTVNNFFN